MNYYNKNALKYIENTKDVNMQEYYGIFLKCLNKGDSILDIGFGSARDLLYFKDNGYEVYGIDPIKEFCDNAKELGIVNIYQQSVLDISFVNKFNAIWAYASLLHLKSNELVEAFNKCYNSLKEKGVMYVSFKYGTFEGIIDDRYFTYLTEESFKEIINKTNFHIEKIWLNEDKLNRDVKWLNVILSK